MDFFIIFPTVAEMDGQAQIVDIKRELNEKKRQVVLLQMVAEQQRYNIFNFNETSYRLLKVKQELEILRQKLSYLTRDRTRK